MMFDFEWPVDRSGYRWVEHESGGSVPRPPALLAVAQALGFIVEDPDKFFASQFPPKPIRRTWLLEGRGGPPRFYRPLDEFPGMFRRFAALKVDRDAILDFTREFGLLGPTAFFDNEFNLIIQRIEAFQSVILALEAGTLVAAASFNTVFRPRFVPIFDLAGMSPALLFQPETLLGAMMLQLADEIRGIARYRKCKQCPEWFPLGKNRATARREFCSDRCRVAWHREHRQGGTP